MSDIFKLKNGSVLLVAEAPGGIYNGDQLKLIAEVSAELNSTVKVTEEQRLCLVTKEEQVEEVKQKLSTVGLNARPYKSELSQPISCIGGFCPLHNQDALDASLRISENLPAGSEGPNMSIGLNGCSQTCAPTHTLDLNIMGEEGGYKISIGGKNSYLPEIASFLAEGVPAEKLPELVANTYQLFRELREGDEALIDVIERVGSSQFIDLFSPYSQDAAGGGDPFGFGDDLSTGAPSEEVASDDFSTDSTDDLGSEIQIEDADDLEETFELDDDMEDVSAVEIEVEDDDLSDEIGDVSIDTDNSLDLETDESMDLDSDIEIADLDGDLSAEEDIELGTDDLDLNHDLEEDNQDILESVSDDDEMDNVTVADELGELESESEELDDSLESLEDVDNFNDVLDQDDSSDDELGNLEDSDISADDSLSIDSDDDVEDFASLDDGLEEVDSLDSGDDLGELSGLDDGLGDLEGSEDLDDGLETLDGSDIDFDSGSNAEISVATPNENLEEDLIVEEDSLEDDSLEIDIDSDDDIALNELEDDAIADDFSEDLNDDVEMVSDEGASEEIGDTMIAGLGEGDIVDAGDEAGAAFEEAFGADLESHSEHGEFEDENEGDREEALSILESNDTIIEDDEEDDLDDLDDDFDENMLDSIGEDLDIEDGLDDDLEESGFDIPPSADSKPKRSPNAISTPPSTMSWDLTGVDMSEAGLKLNFANGARIELAPDALADGSKTLSLGDDNLSIVYSDGEITVSLNGVAISLPSNEAA